MYYKPRVSSGAEVLRPMSIAVLASADPRLVIGQAGDLLASDPVGHNAVGTRLADAIRYGEPGRYWIGLLDGVPAAVAVRQPAGGPLALAPMPPDLVAFIAEAVEGGTGDAGVGDAGTGDAGVADAGTGEAGNVQFGGAALASVFGPARTASRFAELWAGRRQVGATLTSTERIYEVRDLRFPAGVDGALRRAAETDRELLLSWLPGFEAGADWADSDPAAIFVTRRLAAGNVWIWDDGGPVSMAARTEVVAGVSRIQAVNTPAEYRARGYASAGVAALSASVLAQGLRCVLTANTDNSVANSVYRRLGYRAVSDVLRYRLG
jgi:hypothetical protein